VPKIISAMDDSSLQLTVLILPKKERWTDLARESTGQKRPAASGKKLASQDTQYYPNAILLLANPKPQPRQLFDCS
jgi:hypothetical protein